MLFCYIMYCIIDIFIDKYGRENDIMARDSIMDLLISPLLDGKF